MTVARGAEALCDFDQLLAPVRQVRRVQPLAAQQLADLPRRRARVRLGQDLQLVLRGELTPLLGYPFERS